MKLKNSERFVVLDQLRGLAVVLMILFHFTYDLKTFASSPPDLILGLPKWFWFWVPAVIGAIFLFVSGLSLRIARSKNKANSIQKSDLVRLAKIASLALLITIFSLIYMSSAPIYFGILHCIVFGSLLILVLRKASQKLALALGILLLAGGIILEFIDPLPFSWLNWLGFRSSPSPLVSDYYPVMPFAGIMLLGYGFQDKLRDVFLSRANWQLPLPFLEFLGRNSLVIYLIHQPLLATAVKLIS